MTTKKYHLFVGDIMRYEAMFYEDSFVELDDAFQIFIKEEPSVNGLIMQNRDDGGLVETHCFKAEHYTRVLPSGVGEHAYKYSISPLVVERLNERS